MAELGDWATDVAPLLVAADGLLVSSDRASSVASSPFDVVSPRPAQRGPVSCPVQIGHYSRLN